MTVNVMAEHVQAIRMAGCGHVTYLSADHVRARREDHRSYFCSTCGRSNYFPAESDVERERRLRTAAEEQRDTLRERNQETKRQLSAQKAAATRLKNRVGRGVCPCCNRTFRHLQKHMRTKHPEFADQGA